MEKKIQDVTTHLNQIKGKYVIIKTQHKLFGSQTIKCALHLINDNERIGFSIKGQDIYINKCNIYNASISNGICQFEDDLMSIQICNSNA